MSKKIPVAVASVLKPVDDSRMLHKLGFSMRETNKYHLNIIGFSSKKKPQIKNIRFIEIFSKSRMHPARILVSFTFLYHLLRLKPQLVIATTFELLPAAVLGKWLLHYKLVYDVQENYRKNIRFNRSLPALLRPVAEAVVWMAETCTSPFVDGHLLAEACYRHEMPELKRALLLENKAILPDRSYPPFRLAKPCAPLFLITGTITEAYGTQDAIRWFLKLSELLPQARLEILGHCPLKHFGAQLRQEVKHHPQIHLHLSETPLPGGQIAEALLASDVVLLPYRLLPSISAKIPTKLYEGIARQKPLLITPNPVWKALIDAYPAGMEMDFLETGDLALTWQRFSAMEFYRQPPGKEISWEEEKRGFLAFLDSLNSGK